MEHIKDVLDLVKLNFPAVPNSCETSVANMSELIQLNFATFVTGYISSVEHKNVMCVLLIILTEQTSCYVLIIQCTLL